MKCNDQGCGVTENGGESGNAVMGMNDVVLRSTGPLANFQRSPEILQLGTVAMKMEDIDLVPQSAELLYLLHDERAGASIARVGIHCGHDQYSQAHC